MATSKYRPPFDKLRVYGRDTETLEHYPFVLSLSKHEPHSYGTSHLGAL